MKFLLHGIRDVPNFTASVKGFREMYRGKDEALPKPPSRTWYKLTFIIQPRNFGRKRMIKFPGISIHNKHPSTVKVSYKIECNEY
jgi:hypothetical protein